MRFFKSVGLPVSGVFNTALQTNFKRVRAAGDYTKGKVRVAVAATLA